MPPFRTRVCPRLSPRAAKGRCRPRSDFPRQIFKSKAEGAGPPLALPTNRRPAARSLIGQKLLPWKLRRCCRGIAEREASGLGLRGGTISLPEGEVRGSWSVWRQDCT